MSKGVPLREYTDKLFDWLKYEINTRFQDQDKAVQAALASAEKAVTAALIAAKEAVDKANSAGDKRFDSVNEFRNQQKDIISTFLPRPEYSVQQKGMQEKIDSLSTRITSIEGQKQGSGDTWKVIVTIIMVGIAIIGFIGLR